MVGAATDDSAMSATAGTAAPSLPRVGRAVALGGAAMLALALFVLTVAVGSVSIPVGEVVRLLLGQEASEQSWAVIVREVRLPRAVTGLLAGAALGVSGLQMQTLFRNPLADPFILGISAGASLGVALVVLVAGAAGTAMVGGLGLLGNLGVAGAAAVGAAVVTTGVLALSRRVTGPATVLIVGLMAGYATSAIVSVLIYSGFGRLERIQAYVAWGFGSFGGTTWSELQVFVPVLVLGIALSTAGTKQLNALLLGDRYAASMGLHVRRARLAIILAASLMAGTVTAFCGPIAFLGVAVPHLTRGLVRSGDHRLLVPGVALVGAATALTAGLVAQLPGTDTTLPLNSVTSLIGAPVVVAVLLRMRRRGSAVLT